MATKYRIFVKEVWEDPQHNDLETCWVEKFNSLRSAQRRVKQIQTTDKWDCVGDWKLEVEGEIEVYQTA